MNPIELLGHFLRLVGLDVPDEMPGESGIMECVDLRDGFLKAIFSEVFYATCGRLTHPIDWNLLGDGDERDGFRVSLRAKSGCFYTLLNASKGFHDLQSTPGWLGSILYPSPGPSGHSLPSGEGLY